MHLSQFDGIMSALRAAAELLASSGYWGRRRFIRIEIREPYGSGSRVVARAELRPEDKEISIEVA